MLQCWKRIHTLQYEDPQRQKYRQNPTTAHRPKSAANSDDLQLKTTGKVCQRLLMRAIITYGPFHREVNYLYVNIGGRRRPRININDMLPPPSLIVDSGDSHFYVNPARKLVPRNLQCDIAIQLSCP